MIVGVSQKSPQQFQFQNENGFDQIEFLLNVPKPFLILAHARLAAATCAAALATVVATGVTLKPDGLLKVAAGAMVNGPVSGAPMVAPVVSNAVAVKDPAAGAAAGVNGAMNDQGGDSVPFSSTADCTVPVVSVRTTETLASAVLPEGSGREVMAN